ncbi:MAG: sulfatase [Kiritimatiellaeota bacterium]|nr:sulfatase [Kiritimatiellota bacterium]
MPTASNPKPNVVLLISHDTGKMYSPYGHTTVRMPHFEKLARQSVTFDRCFCTTPLCAPARAALTTGRYPHQNGVNGLPGETLGNLDLVERDRHLANVLKRNGYRAVLCGFEHETIDMFGAGFEEGIHGIGHYNNGGDGDILDSGKAITRWFQRNPGAGTTTPFYLQIGCPDTHRDWDYVEGPYDEQGVWKAPYLIDSPEVDREMAIQQAACNHLDAGLGVIMDALDRQGVSQNTLFVITTDHGIDFPRAKGTLFDPGVEVGLFMRFDNGGWARGARCPLLASHVDVYPTVLEACGIPVPEGAEGRSLLPALRDPAGATPVRDTVFLEKTYHDNYDPMRGLRTGHHKYVMNFDAQTLYDVRIATAPRYNWFKFPFAKLQREELYDLREDPDESNNLAKNPAFDVLRLSLKKRLADWMLATHDPLLDGPMPSPLHLRTSREMRELALQK